MNKSSAVCHNGFSFKVTLNDWMLISSSFSCLLLFGRIIITESPGYIFLPWNLFLAFVPYWISGRITRITSVKKNKIKLVLYLFGWLLFIPNSFYILTDLIHFARIRSAPKWFDLLMIFSFAWNGIFFGIISLRKVEMFMSDLLGKRFSVWLLFCVMWLCAFGVYIGRYLRFNSWDILTDPFSLAEEILNIVIHPFDNGYAWGMTLCYSVFMTLVYFMFKKIGETFYSSEN